MASQIEFVIPAKAGVHAFLRFLDSRFRGNDVLNRTIMILFKTLNCYTFYCFALSLSSKSSPPTPTSSGVDSLRYTTKADFSMPVSLLAVSVNDFIISFLFALSSFGP